MENTLYMKIFMRLVMTSDILSSEKMIVKLGITPDRAWKKYIAGPRRAKLNPQFGSGGGWEYRIGGF